MTSVPLNKFRASRLAKTSQQILMQLYPRIPQSMHMQRRHAKLILYLGSCIIVLLRQLRYPDVVPAVHGPVTETVRRHSRGHYDAEFPPHAGEAGRGGVLLEAELVFQQHAEGQFGALAEADQAGPLAGAGVGVHGARQAVFDFCDGGFVVEGWVLG